MVVRTAIADREGLFRLAAPTAELDGFSIHAWALGYYSWTEALPSVENGAAQVEIRLAASPVSLEGLDVEVERRVMALEQAGFYDRVLTEGGIHIDYSLKPPRPSAFNFGDLLRGYPGVNIDSNGMVSFLGTRTLHQNGFCPYRVYLDGIEVVNGVNMFDPPLWTKSLIHPMDVQAIEVYRRPSEVPVQWAGARGMCGLILIWSKQ